jgi:hypothetical protein
VIEMDAGSMWEILVKLLDSNLSDAMLTLVFVYILVAAILRNHAETTGKLIELLRSMVERRK